MRVEGGKAVAGGFRFWGTHRLNAKQHLSLQVARVHGVKIDDSNPTHAGRGEVQEERGAETTRPNHEDA